MLSTSTGSASGGHGDRDGDGDGSVTSSPSMLSFISSTSSSTGDDTPPTSAHFLDGPSTSHHGIVNAMNEFITTITGEFSQAAAQPGMDNVDKTMTTTTMTTMASHHPDLLPPTANKMNVNDLSNSLQHFGLVDYIVFILMLIICAVIGFYFGFIEKKKKNKKKKDRKQNNHDDDDNERRGSEALDYLVGGRKMKVLPVSLSLVASFISGISLLGTSTEIYVYGTQYAFILLTLILSGIISWYVFLPVFCNLQLTSTYEYFEMRYDKRIRLFGSVLFIFGTILWLPIVIYVPALSFNQVTGTDPHIITPIVCIVCIFYTCVGGLKAVVWTDVIQTIIMIGAIIFVMIKGTLEVGGFDIVWERNRQSDRIELPEMTFDPTVRISMLSLLLGGTVHNLQITAGSQVITQRYLSLPGLKEARHALIYFIVGIMGLTLFTCYNGMLIFATYYDCDPLSTNLAKAGDQLVPLLVMDVLGFLPGLPGIFIAGVFSAALSSLSTGLNSLSAVFLEDFIKPHRRTLLSERQTAVIMRSVVVVVGIVCVLLVYVVEHLGAVIMINMTFGSVINGPLLSLFLMGFLMPWINGKSALCGCIASFGLTTLIVVKGQLAIALGEFSYPVKPVSIDGCDYAFDAAEALNSTIHTTQPTPTTDGFWHYIFHISFFLYIFVGSLLTIIFAHIASLYFGFNDTTQIDPELLAPIARWYLKTHKYTSVPSPPPPPAIHPHRTELRNLVEGNEKDV